MFEGAISFNQDLSSWNVGQVGIEVQSDGTQSMKDMFVGATAFSTENYSNFLIGCAAQAVRSGVQLDASATPNADGETAKTTLRGNPYNWTINDGGT